MELNPVCRRCAADEYEFVLFQVKQNPVSNDKSIVAAGNKLLGLVDAEIRKGIDRKIRDHLESIRAFNVDVDHVVRLIEKYAGLTPGFLFVPQLVNSAGTTG